MVNYLNKLQAKTETGLDKIGSVNESAKHFKAYKYNELVYTIYLAPAKSSGYEVCAGRTAECTKLCLNESGMNTMDGYDGRINKSRIKKTQLFYENRELFVRWMIAEINTMIAKAKKLEYNYSVRLNNTSDLSPELFYINDNGTKRNILEIFPDVQFYDYTKVANRVKLMAKYPNYDLTYSYSGENMDECITMLENNVRVAVVFRNVPTVFIGKEVIDGDKYDMRYRDPKNCVVGLKFKRVRTKLTESSFVI